jgi:multidrug efflux pump subunit AcrA (membrane-fusion protein)
MEWEQGKVSLDMYKARVDRLRLYAPFDGIIESVNVDLGASVGEEDPVLRIVNTDVLKIDVAVDTDETLRLMLKPGDEAWILVDVPGDRHVYKGTVTQVSPVAYFATRQRPVRVEMENPEGWPAGLAAWMRFTAPEGEWTSRVVDSGEAKPRVLTYADRTFLRDRFMFDEWMSRSREGGQ